MRSTVRPSALSSAAEAEAPAVEPAKYGFAINKVEIFDSGFVIAVISQKVFQSDGQTIILYEDKCNWLQ